MSSEFSDNLKFDGAKTFSPVAKGNLNVLLMAAGDKQLGMLACKFKETGEDVAVICAFTPKTMIPLAVIFDNIMDRVTPPEGVKELSEEDIELLKKMKTEEVPPQTKEG